MFKVMVEVNGVWSIHRRCNTSFLAENYKRELIENGINAKVEIGK